LGKQEINTKYQSANLVGIGHMGDLGINVRVLLKYILEK